MPKPRCTAARTSPPSAAHVQRAQQGAVRRQPSQEGARALHAALCADVRMELQAGPHHGIGASQQAMEGATHKRQHPRAAAGVGYHMGKGQARAGACRLTPAGAAMRPAAAHRVGRSHLAKMASSTGSGSWASCREQRPAGAIGVALPALPQRAPVGRQAAAAAAESQGASEPLATVI